MPHRRIHTNDLATIGPGGRRRWGSPWQSARQSRGSLVESNGYTRNHASWLLRCWGRTVYSYQGGRPVKIVVGTRRPRRRSPQLYDQEVYRALKHVWELFGGMCGKRLVAVLRPVLEKFRGTEPGTAGARQAAAYQRAEKRKLQPKGGVGSALRELSREAREIWNDDVEPHLYEVPGSRNKSGRTSTRRTSVTTYQADRADASPIPDASGNVHRPRPSRQPGSSFDRRELRSMREGIYHGLRASSVST